MRQSDNPAKHPLIGRRLRLRMLTALLGTVVALGACFNSHVFDIIDPCEVQQTSIGQSIEPATAADILIVIDNSGSMCEEQENLVANFFNDDESECPLANPAAYELEEYQNPSDGVVNTDLAQCGFIQILAAYDNDFRVGVITTDVGPCDNRFGTAGIAAFSCDGQTAYPDWGRRPQKGCLQAPPGTAQKYLDPGTENIGEKFAAILDNTLTYGGAFERGLDAVKFFLDPETERHETCASDLDDFIRPEASLLVVYVTDEDDCSYTPSDAFPDEAFGESCENQTEAPWMSRGDNAVEPAWCYDRQEFLNPVSQYADFLKSYKGNDGTVKIAVIAGATKDNGVEPAGCRIVDGTPDGTCTPSKGNSNITAAGFLCNPQNLQDEGLPPCCEADSGNRYYELASAFPDNQSFTDSICFQSFRTTMRQLAAFAAKVDSVLLAEPPAVPAAITVEILRDGDAEPERIERIPDDEPNPDDLNGWQLTVDDGNNYKVSFYGDAVPQPGDDIAVYVLDEGDTSAGDAEPCIGFGGNASRDAGG